MADVKYPGIPAISSVVPREVSSVLAPMKEILQAFVDGNLPQRGILNGLRTVGYVDAAGRPSVPPGAIVVDNTPPPAPTGLEADGAIANVILSWDDVPDEIRPRIAYTEIWRAEVNDISVAQLVGQSTASVYVDAIGAAAVRYYWIRYVSPAPTTPPIAGPYNKQTGTRGETSTDPNVLIDLLVGAGNSGLFYKQEDPSLVINGVPVPVGVYMRDTYIANGTISRAKIANAAIDNAKIANLDAGKITTGLLSADRIDVNAIKAAIGTFTEANIGNASIGWAKLYGDMYSDNWIGSGGSAGWYLSRGGEFYAQNGHFRGSIDATSGNFSGNVNAASFNGQVIGTGNIVNRAVSDSVYMQNIWPGGFGNGDFSATGHFQSQPFTLAYDCHCFLYGGISSGQVFYWFDVAVTNAAGEGGAGAIYPGAHTANVRMVVGADHDSVSLAFLPAGTYYLNSGTVTDGSSSTGAAYARLVFLKV